MISIKRIIATMCIIASVSIISGCLNMQYTASGNENYYKKMYERLLVKQPPEITDIRFETTDGKVLKETDNWIILKSRVKIRISLKGHADIVELYIVPTGTETYKLQRLINVVYPRSGIAEYIWDVPENTMGHLWVVAYNENIGRKSETINVIRQE